jgi:hypothetical protein
VTDARAVIRLAAALGATSISMGQAACGRSGCSSIFVAGPTITVVDATTMQPICDATILVRSENPFGTGTGAAEESQTSRTTDAGVDGSAPLQVFPGSNDGGQGCTYMGGQLVGVLGLFTLQVSHAGYATETVSNVYVTSVSCMSNGEPESEPVVVLLHPTGS